MHNRLCRETSPYLLQHKDNPVNWYPWCEEAFARARAEDKPVFLSIGYSTCHWCHVMAHESFADEEVARLLNRDFIAIKVDKEERPDIDHIYMEVCQAFTGSGGWPTSIFMTPEQKPFFAGTYFPKHSRGRVLGFVELLRALGQMWQSDRAALTTQAERVLRRLEQHITPDAAADTALAEQAVAIFHCTFDAENGGFGRAPKFPSAHNLLFLLEYGAREQDPVCLEMAEHTLLQMYRGGLFDHIGYGFCRYSTDERFLVPHFEKMLYDNALLILAYCKAYTVTRKPLYREIAGKTADYILRELTDAEGGFYSAQDADSDGEEGKFYLLTPEEVCRLLGPGPGEQFNRQFGITAAGNFAGKNIPNRLDSDPEDDSLDGYLPQLRQYRRQRCQLHLDDKILTAWNGLMIAALCQLYQVSGETRWLTAARKAEHFLRRELYPDGKLYASYRGGVRGKPGFLQDYAGALYAELALYAATWDREHLARAEQLCRQTMEEFLDPVDGGFFLYGSGGETLILRPKETYDGAMPSGNSLMAWNLVRLWLVTGDPAYGQAGRRQLDFLAGAAASYPAGYTMYLRALLDYFEPPETITVVSEEAGVEPQRLPSDAVVRVLPKPTAEYPLKNGKTTYYVCRNHCCYPPGNDLNRLLSEE